MKDISTKLTKKEEQVMELFWNNGAMFIRELQEKYDEPRPHFNTLSTVVRGLQSRGFIDFKTFGGSYQYFAAVSREQYSELVVESVIDKYFDRPLSAVSALVESEKISLDELQELIDLVKNNK